MTTKSRAEAKADEKVDQKLEQHEENRRAEQTDNGSEQEANEQAEAVQEDSYERAGALSAPSGDMGYKVDDTAVAQPPIPVPSTSIDKNGVERITDGTDRDGWVPAPVDPHPTQVEKAEERNKDFEQKLEETKQEVAKAVSGGGNAGDN